MESQSGELTPVVELVKLMVQALVDFPERIEVNAIEGHMSTVIEVRTGPGDMGKLVGKQGRTADALRTLLIAFGGRYKRRFILEIIDSRERGGR
ncbi:MAG: KH domain-containing protein [Myxococcota bacterium]